MTVSQKTYLSSIIEQNKALVIEYSLPHFFQNCRSQGHIFMNKQTMYFFNISVTSFSKIMLKLCEILAEYQF